MPFFYKQLIENVKEHSNRAAHVFKLKRLHYANEIEIGNYRGTPPSPIALFAVQGDRAQLTESKD